MRVRASAQREANADAAWWDREIRPLVSSCGRTMPVCYGAGVEIKPGVDLGISMTEYLRRADTLCADTDEGRAMRLAQRDRFNNRRTANENERAGRQN